MFCAVQPLLGFLFSVCLCTYRVLSTLLIIYYYLSENYCSKIDLNLLMIAFLAAGGSGSDRIVILFLTNVFFYFESMLRF